MYCKFQHTKKKAFENTQTLENISKIGRGWEHETKGQNSFTIPDILSAGCLPQPAEQHWQPAVFFLGQ